MTVAALPSTASYVENGVTTVFAVPFRFKAAGDLVVDRVVAGASLPLQLGVDYSVTGGDTDAGGTLTRAAATNGGRLRVRRRTAIAQPMVYTTGDRFPAKSHEEALDRGILIAQELSDQANDTATRALLVPIGEASVALPAATDRAGRFLAFGPDGAPLVASGTGTDAGLRTDLATAGLGASLIAFGASTVQAVLDMHLLGTPGLVADGVTDTTAAVQLFANACIAAGRPVRACLDGLAIAIATVDWSGANNIIVDGAGATIKPATQTGGRFIQTSGSNMEYRHSRFAQTAGYNYQPAIQITGVTGELRIVENWFDGCGFGAKAQTCGTVLYRRNRLTELGIYPRPAAIGAADASGFLAGFESYGTGLKADTCDSARFDDNVLVNSQPAGGHVIDGSGGGGGFVAYFCNDVLFQGGLADGAPGQGFLGVGEWQGTDVVGQMLTFLNGGAQFDFGKNGRNIRFIGCKARYSNQEGMTAFGAGNVTITGCQSEMNRTCGIEAWQCWNVTIEDNKLFEPENGSNPVYNETIGSTQLVGDAIHVVGCSGAIVQGNLIRQARLNAIVGDGSYDVLIDGNMIRDYGRQDMPSSNIASGISLDSYNGLMADEFIITNNRFRHILQSNNAGADIFIGAAGTTIHVADNSAVGRAVTTVNYDIPTGLGRYIGDQRLEIGGTMMRPFARVTAGGVTMGISGSATTILALPRIITGQTNEYEVTLAITDDSNGDTTAIEKLLVVLTAAGTGAYSVLGSAVNGAVGVRTYAIAAGNMQVSFASGTYTVKVVKVEAFITGSRFV